MKKAVLFLLICLSITPESVFSQFSKDVVVVPKRFKSGDMYYASSYNGIKTFMYDLQSENPELSQKLMPQFNKIKRKRRRALVTIVSSGVIGMTIS